MSTDSIAVLPHDADRDALGRQLMKLLAGRDAFIVLATLTDLMACGLCLVASDRADAERLIDEIVPELKASTRLNFENIKRQKIAAGHSGGRA